MKFRGRQRWFERVKTEHRQKNGDRMTRDRVRQKNRHSERKTDGNSENQNQKNHGRETQKEREIQRLVDLES